MLNTIKQTITTVTVMAFMFAGILPALEPAIVSAVTDDIVVTQTVDSGIAITSPSDVVMSRSIGLTANTAIGNVTWNIKTTDVDGYTLTVKASTDPAMANGTDSFTDYTETVAGTPEAWTVSNAYEFGLSAFGDDVADATYGTGSTCGAAHTVDSNLKYRGFDGTTEINIASKTSSTAQAGADTTVCFASEQDTVNAPSGVYTATVTATALVQ